MCSLLVLTFEPKASGTEYVKYNHSFDSPAIKLERIRILYLYLIGNSLHRRNYFKSQVDEFVFPTGDYYFQTKHD